MKDRMTLGFQSDAAETAALTLRDNCAAMRVFAYCDWEHDKPLIGKAERRRANAHAKRKERAFDRIRKAFGEEYATWVANVLHQASSGRNPACEKLFDDILKKIEKKFHPRK